MELFFILLTSYLLLCVIFFLTFREEIATTKEEVVLSSLGHLNQFTRFGRTFDLMLLLFFPLIFVILFLYQKKINKNPYLRLILISKNFEKLNEKTKKNFEESIRIAMQKLNLKDHGREQ